MKIALRVACGVALIAALATRVAFSVEAENHYILPCAPDCRDEPEAPIGPGMTGSWYNGGQVGQGFSIQVLPGQPLRLMVSWFVFGPNGGQAWIVGEGPVNGTRAVLPAYQMSGAGARFPPAFDPQNVHADAWGTLTFTFSDCNHGKVTWTSTVSGYTNGAMELQRLTLPAGVTCRADDPAGELR